LSNGDTSGEGVGSVRVWGQTFDLSRAAGNASEWRVSLQRVELEHGKRRTKV
jgi:hypothetical protein